MTPPRSNNGNCSLLRLERNLGVINIAKEETQKFYMQVDDMYSSEVLKKILDETEKVRLEHQI